MEKEGYLAHDAKLGRYKVTNRPGMNDYRLHAGEYLELWIDEQWTRVRIELLSNEQNKNTWKFIDDHGRVVVPSEGQRVRLIGDAHQKSVVSG